MCEHCAKMNEVLTELMGPKVAGVIMRRVESRLHPIDPIDASGISQKLIVVTQ